MLHLRENVFEERIYELSSEALAEQERQVGETRGRGAAILASGAVVIGSLLAKPVFHDGHPSGGIETVATIAGLLGCVGVLAFVVMLLLPRELGFSVKSGATYRSLWEKGIIEQPLVDLALAEAFEERREENRATVRSFHALPRLCARVTGHRDGWSSAFGGAKLIKMADDARKDTPTPAKPAGIPKPGTVPKLPQTIFNLEKRGGSPPSRRTIAHPRPKRG